jgi:hypothetical protein
MITKGRWRWVIQMAAVRWNLPGLYVEPCAKELIERDVEGLLWSQFQHGILGCWYFHHVVPV